MRNQLRVAADMHFIVAARCVAGATWHRQAEMIAAVPIQIAAGDGGVLQALAARPVSEHGEIHAAVELVAAYGGGGAHADGGSRKADDGDYCEFVHGVLP